MRALLATIVVGVAVLASSAPAAAEGWQVATTSSAASPAALSGVDLSAPGDGWAVGYRTPRRNRPPAAIAQRWNGARFVATSAPSVGTASRLEDVDAVSPDLAWAVGSAEHGDYFDTQPIALRWNGSSWTASLTRLFPAPACPPSSGWPPSPPTTCGPSVVPRAQP